MHQVHGIKYAWPALVILAMFWPIGFGYMLAAWREHRESQERRRREWLRRDCETGCCDDDCAHRDYSGSLRK